MKKYFKSPEALAKTTPQDLTKTLKKIFAKQADETVSFFYKADFSYSGDEKAPMLYLGPVSGLWKQYAKQEKSQTDFAGGLCKVMKDENGNSKLLLQVTKGKGKKAKFLKEINKQLLKRLQIEAEFVATLEEDEQAEPDTATEEEGALSPLKSVSAGFKEIVNTFKAVRQGVHDMELVSELKEDLKEWVKEYENLSNEEQAKLKKQKATLPKVSEGIKKIILIDKNLQKQLKTLMDLGSQFNDENSNKEDVRAEGIELCDEIINLAEKVNDNVLINNVLSFKNQLTA